MNERHAGRVEWRFPEDHGQGEGKGILIIRRDGTQMGAERSLGRLEESGRIEMGKQLGTAERRKRSYPASVATLWRARKAAVCSDGQRVAEK